MERNKSDAYLVSGGIEHSIVSDNLLFVFQIVNNVVISQTIAIFGSVANIVNIVVFAKIGTKDTVNVCLLGLAVSDFGACFMMIGASLALNPWFNRLTLPFHPRQVLYLLCGWPRVVCTKITIIITTFVTFERCLCVAMPLKVKSVVTHKRIKIFLLSSCVLIVASYTPLYYANRLGWRFNPTQNASILGVIFSENREEIESALFIFHSLVFSNLAFTLIVIFTAILTVELKRKSKWRKEAVTRSSDLSSKETKIVKMVIIISTFFVACYMPHSLFLIFLSTYSSFSITGAQANLFVSVVSFMVILETANSALNIFIYYYNSSVYRTKFNRVFRVGEKNP